VPGASDEEADEAHLPAVAVVDGHRYPDDALIGFEHPHGGTVGHGDRHVDEHRHGNGNGDGDGNGFTVPDGHDAAHHGHTHLQPVAHGHAAHESAAHESAAHESAARWFPVAGPP
jgi:hypothetical protein